jgi:sec-independent protein translocase protein TatC
MAKAAEPEQPEELSKDAELEAGRMPFMQHLGELRDRVRNAAIAFVVAFLVCWGFADDIFAWLCRPMYDIWDRHSGPEIERLIQLKLLPASWNWGPSKMIYIGLTEPFWVNMSVALWAGIFVASPIIFYQLWRFIAPGLYKRERKIAAAFTVLSAVFFISGALFCYRYALPALNNYMLGYNSAHLQAQLQIEKYLDLTRDMMLAFGAVFEMPLLIYFLAMIGMVTHRSLWKFSRWFIVLAFIIGAVLTPGPDVVSQFLMAIPMIGLYFISILFAWQVTARRERAAAEQRARDDASVKPKRRVIVEDDDDPAGPDV